MISVKSIITRAFDFSGVHTNTGNPLPAEFFSTGLNALKGIVASLNTRDLLLWTQNRLRVTPNSKIIKIDAEDPNVGVRIASISSVIELKQKVPLRFVPLSLIDNFSESDKVYTARQTSDKIWELEVKQSSVNKELSIVYNEKIECEMNTEYYAPEEYSELLVLALTSKLLTIFPRIDGSMKESVDGQLQRMIINIQSKQSNTKLIMSNKYSNESVFSTFLNGWY